MQRRFILTADIHNVRTHRSATSHSVSLVLNDANINWNAVQSSAEWLLIQAFGPLSGFQWVNTQWVWTQFVSKFVFSYWHWIVKLIPA
jgi:hypothetical protein